MKNQEFRKIVNTEKHSCLFDSYSIVQNIAKSETTDESSMEEENYCY
jgi:hypothetical protein